MPMFVLVVANTETGQTTFHTCDAEVVVGRGDDVQVRLSDPFVSRHHIRISAELDGFRVVDLDSTNGTVIKGEPIAAGGVALSWDDTVTIGPYVLSFELPDKPTAKAGSNWGTGRTGPRVSLDRPRRALIVDGRPSIEPLTQHEFVLLNLLDNEAHAVVEREAIGDAIWGAGQWDVYMLHNVVSRLRRRLTAAGIKDDLLLTVTGYGYRLL